MCVREGVRDRAKTEKWLTMDAIFKTVFQQMASTLKNTPIYYYHYAQVNNTLNQTQLWLAWQLSCAIYSSRLLLGINIEHMCSS